MQTPATQHFSKQAEGVQWKEAATPKCSKNLPVFDERLAPMSATSLLGVILTLFGCKLIPAKHQEKAMSSS